MFEPQKIFVNVVRFYRINGNRLNTAIVDKLLLLLELNNPIK